MKRLFFLLAAWLGAASGVTAQIVLHGNVSNGRKEPVPFASVALLPANDTTRVVGGITDAKGDYMLGNLRPGGYRLMISSIGYKGREETLVLRMPAGGNRVRKDYVLEEDPVALEEVVVKAGRKSVYADKSVYTFTEGQREQARHSADLLEHVGDLATDPVDGSIRKMNGGGVTILINGLHAGVADLKSIPPDKVKRVEYYETPPARYMASGALVNVITRQLDTGLTGGFDVSHAFTTGFANDGAYIRSVWGNQQLALDYTVNYRKYRKRYATDTYDYLINGQDIREEYFGRNKFGYTTHGINLKYIYSRPDEVAFQAVFTPGFEKRFNKAGTSISTWEDGGRSSRSGNTDNHSRVFGPSLDLYLSKSLPGGQEVTANAVGTYYHSRQDRLNREADGEGAPVMDDRMRLRTRKYSLIGEGAYSRKAGLNEWNAGYRFTYSTSSSTIRNGFSGYEPYDYRSGYQTHYFYGECSGVWKSLMFRASLGGTYVYSHNDDASYRKFLFTPVLVVARKFNDNHSLQYRLMSEPIVPDISQLSNNSAQITYRLCHTGNPYLKTGNELGQSLLYNWKNSWLDLSVAALYIRDFSPISMFYTQGDVGGEPCLVSTAVRLGLFADADAPEGPPHRQGLWLLHPAEAVRFLGEEIFAWLLPAVLRDILAPEGMGDFLPGLAPVVPNRRLAPAEGRKQKPLPGLPPARAAALHGGMLLGVYQIEIQVGHAARQRLAPLVLVLYQRQPLHVCLRGELEFLERQGMVHQKEDGQQGFG